MNLARTPQQYDMESGDLIDVKYETPPSPPPKERIGQNCGSLRKYVLKIMLRFRINGSDKTVQEFSLLPTDSFQTCMDSFCKKNLVADPGQVSFVLDGGKIDMRCTPENEDLEGGEIIDVLWNKQNDTRTEKLCPVVQAPQPHVPIDVTPITIKTKRNMQDRSKQFRIHQEDTLLKLKQGYMKYYKAKGCRNVKFYFKTLWLQNESATLSSLGLSDNDIIYAMENGKPYQP